MHFVYKKVAVAEQFFDIIYSVHVESSADTQVQIFLLKGVFTKIKKNMVIPESLYSCIRVSYSHGALYPCIPVSLYPSIPVFLYLLASLYPCIPVSLYPFSLYPCIPVSLYPYIPVPLYPCIPVSLYPCIPVTL